MNFRRALALAATLFLATGPVMAQEPVWHGGVTTIGELKYKDGFTRFDYVNPDAPKGGELKLSAIGTYDTFNPILSKGEAPAGVASLVFDTLLKSAEDEVTASYGLLAESVSYPDDFSSATFRLRPEAKWADGQPVTPEDVIFSFDMSKEHNPLLSNYYRHVVSAEKNRRARHHLPLRREEQPRASQHSRPVSDRAEALVGRSGCQGQQARYQPHHAGTGHGLRALQDRCLPGRRFDPLRIA